MRAYLETNFILAFDLPVDPEFLDDEGNDTRDALDCPCVRYEDVEGELVEQADYEYRAHNGDWETDDEGYRAWNHIQELEVEANIRFQQRLKEELDYLRLTGQEPPPGYYW